MNLGEPIANGNTANIYLHEGKVIKVFHDFLPDREAEQEANKQKYAYSHGLSVPCVLDVTTLNGKQVIIMEHVEGRTIGSILLDDLTKAEQYLSLSVDVQMKIHEVVADNFEPMKDKLYKQINRASALSEKQKNALIERLYTLQSGKQLCHGDFHVSNLILYKNTVTIIDWVDSSSGDIRADVSRTHVLYSQFSKDLADLYFRIYCEKSGLSQDDIVKWEPIIAGARLAEHVSTENEDRLTSIVNRFCPE